MLSPLVGYMRVSKADGSQVLDLQKDALIAAVQSGRLFAALDVYHREPLPADHPLIRCPNTVLTPHLGYSAFEVYAEYYQHSVENALAFLDGKPVRVLEHAVH